MRPVSCWKGEERGEGGGEEGEHLRDDGQLCPEGINAQAGNVHPINQYAPLQLVNQPKQSEHEGRLARACAPHYPHRHAALQACVGISLPLWCLLHPGLQGGA